MLAGLIRPLNCLILGLCAPGLWASELPGDAEAELREYHERIAELRERYRAQIEERREDLQRRLQREIERDTRAGRLDRALAIRNALENVDAPGAGAEAEAAAEPGSPAAGLDLLGAAQTQTQTDDAPAWHAAMRAVHRSGRGWTRRGSIAMFGAGLLHSRATILPFKFGHVDARWGPMIERLNFDVIDERKNLGHGNDRIMHASKVASAIDDFLEQQRPEIALIQLDDSTHHMLENALERIVTACIEAGTIPIMICRFPRPQNPEPQIKSNAVMRSVADRHDIPLVDLPAELDARYPDGSWRGSVVKGHGSATYRDKTQHLDFSEANLKQNGLALFNLLVAERLLEVIEHCCAED